jgi:hypothetical protein
MDIFIPTLLSDAELITGLTRIAGRERESTAQLVAHLAELDARKLYLGAGFSSLFAYCCEVLRLSEHETYNRIEAARVARRFPIVLEALAEGALNLTTVRLLAPHLDDQNHRELLAAAAHRTKRDVEEQIAVRFPRPDVPTSMRKLPGPRAVGPSPGRKGPGSAQEFAGSGATVSTTSMASSDGAASTDPTSTTTSPRSSPPARRAVVAPLAPGRYEIRFTARAETSEKLRRAQDLLRHAVPNGDVAEIVDRALSALLEDLARRKCAAVRSAQPAGENPRPSSRSRHVPAAVRRAVWLRDSGRCAFVAAAGRRCKESGFLEFHHVMPYGVGGEASAANIELRCRAHNAHEAELFYGPRASRLLQGTSSTRSGPSRSRSSALTPGG